MNHPQIPRALGQPPGSSTQMQASDGGNTAERDQRALGGWGLQADKNPFTDRFYSYCFLKTPTWGSHHLFCTELSSWSELFS